MYFILLVFIAVMGAIVGSFSIAQVWRIRAFQLNADKKSGIKVNKDEWSKLKVLLDKKINKDRSRCLSCGRQLTWRDLIPVVSWIYLKGKCRSCHSKIGITEFLAEVLMAILFATLFIVNFGFSGSFEYISIWHIVNFLTLLISVSLLCILFTYDFKWSLLPTKILYSFIIISAVYWAAAFVKNGTEFSGQSLLNIAISMLVFPFVYFLLTTISKGKWVGSGDWLLAIGLVFLLPNMFVYSILLMFLSNVLGMIFIIILGILKKKQLKRGAQIPFGPPMIVAALCILLMASLIDRAMVFLDLL